MRFVRCLRWRRAVAFGLTIAVAGFAGIAGTRDAIGAPPNTEDYYGRLAAAARAKYSAIVAARAPKIVPPVPIKPIWKVIRIGAFELGAPLVALTSGNLDGDPKSGELYAVTPREVIAIGFRNGKLVELGRAAFAGERATPEPRDVVGTAVIEGDEVVVAASSWAKELRVKWQGKSLVAQQGGAGFLVCPNARVQLQPGRNHFSNGTFEARCRTDLVDKDGHPIRVRAELAMTGKLGVVVERCAGTTCESTGKFELSNVGIAFAIADVDRDGTAEVIVSDASAPRDPDSVKVFSLGSDERKPMFKRTFAGGVAGLVVIDGDDADDIAEVIAAVRFPGSTRVDLWRLN